MASSYYALALPLLLILPLFPPTTHTQTATLLNFAPGALPSCANTCTALYNAQDVCVPPAAPKTDQATYQSCFCQSAYLAPLYTSSAGVCDQACGGADLTQIQSWYKGLCGQRGAAAGVAPVPSSSGSSSTMATTTTGGAKGTGVVGAKGTSSPSAVVQSNASNGPQGDWFRTHWRWVVMLIVLFVGLALLALASTLLHRRHRRKKGMPAGMVGTSAAAVEAWYPQSRSVHDLNPPVDREKGKGVAGVNVMERVPRGTEEKKGRLKKSWLRGGR